jgi:hypothetical protein
VISRRVLRQLSAGALVGTVVAFAALVSSPAPSGAAASGPVFIVSPSTVALGDTMLVEFDGWPAGPVTAAVCGNAALRGSEDCDQVGAESIAVRGSAPVRLRLTATEPPVGCPCVVRANNTASTVVRTAPIDIIGVPGGVHIPAATGPAPASSLVVEARVVQPSRGIPGSWAAPFAAPTHKALILELKNVGATPLQGLRVAGTVGRDASSGAPIAQDIPGAIAPQGHATVRVPFVLSAPVWGTYTIAGSIYGLAAPVTFTASTHNDPWGVELAAIVLLLLAAQLARRRERERRRAAALAPVPDPEVASAGAVQCSPDVGAPYGASYRSDPYDRVRHAYPSVIDVQGADGSSPAGVREPARP